jgi:uncharacterized hydrophobic protein (TIGR00271 family)
VIRRAIRHSIDAGVAYRVPAEVLLDSVLPNIGDTRAKASAFWFLLTCSSIIAAAGVMTDSTAVVIGAMVIAPLGTPIYGIAAALVAGVRSGPSVMRVLGGVALAIAIGLGVDLVTIERFAADANPQILARTSPSLVDLMVAFATGLAGSLALVRLDISPALPGVAIAISLVPPLTVVGITLAQGEFGLAFGALLLFATNMVAIVLAGLLVFSTAKLDAPFEEHVSPAPRAKRTLIAASVVVVLALVGGTIRAAYLLGEVIKVREVATDYASEQKAWELLSVERSGSEIVVVMLARPGAKEPTPPGSATFDDELDGITSDVIVQFETGARLEL